MKIPLPSRMQIYRWERIAKRHAKYLAAFVDVEYAGDYLGIHPESARRLWRQGRLPGWRVGMKILIPRDMLAEYKALYIAAPGNHGNEEELNAYWLRLETFSRSFSNRLSAAVKYQPNRAEPQP